ncbi:hypothetical protein CK203_067804 [Vitis vinifera]|uniref:Uncharacterized protein n=1 Tax=Vitis vinifera TaxID=29760 RepID=A0A438BZG3_VITVI|nr:hypothetical protein CK203_067804 [Vitis vinifera]
MHQKTRRRLFSATASADTGSSEMSNLSLPENQGSRQPSSYFLNLSLLWSPQLKLSKRSFWWRMKNMLNQRKALVGGIQICKRTKVPRENQKNKDCNLPCRSSKRLAGLKPDLVGNSGSSEQALAVADKISGKSEVIPALAIEAPSDVEQSKKDNRHLEDEAVQEEEAGKLETGKRLVMSRSCHQWTSLLWMSVPSLMHKKILYPDSTLLQNHQFAQGNVSLPGCSGISHGQCSLEGNKEYPTRGIERIGTTVRVTLPVKLQASMKDTSDN